MIQQFQPKYDPPLTIEPEPIKTTDTIKQSNLIPAPINTVIPMPFTVITKRTPITDDTKIEDKDKI